MMDDITKKKVLERGAQIKEAFQALGSDWNVTCVEGSAYISVYQKSRKESFSVPLSHEPPVAHAWFVYMLAEAARVFRITTDFKPGGRHMVEFDEFAQFADDISWAAARVIIATRGKKRVGHDKRQKFVATKPKVYGHQKNR